MNFFQLLVEGFVLFGVNAVLGGLLFLVFRGYVQRRVEDWLFGAIHGYLQEQLRLVLEHPDETSRVLSPLLKAIVAEVLKDFQKGQGEGMIKIPFLGKVPPQLVQMFLERFLGGSRKPNNEGGNPFA